ncbi:MAG: VIT domain-containing protein [Phycisphaerales bacterium JB040]
MNARGIKTITAAALLALCGAIGTGHAQPETITREPIRIVPQRHWHAEVAIESIAASVRLKDRVATTELAITLRNPTNRPLEAELLLPVPQGSAIKRFGLDGLNEGTAELLPAEEAKRIYRDIVRQMIDPGLLEFVGNALVRSSVFPVPANGTQVFRVTYEQVLPYHDGRIDYTLPRSEALGTAGVAWSIEVSLESGDGIGTVYSPSHGLQSTTDANGRRDLTVTNPAAPGSFRLSYLKHDTQSLACWLYPDARIGDGDGGYFMLVADAPERDASIEIRRELTIVIDRSGSMANGKLDQAVAAAKQVIGGLRDGESFNIVDYADEVERFRSEPVAKNAETSAAALAYLDSLQARGGTNLHDALLASLSQPATEGTLPMVLFMTDGLATVGVTDESTIRSTANAGNRSERRVFTFGVGHDVNAPLLSGIAEESRGAPTYIEPGEDVEVKVGQVFAKLDGPVLTDTAFRAVLASEFEISAPRIGSDGSIAGYSNISRLVLPGRLPDLFDGDQIVIFGQYTTGQEFYVELRGDAGDDNWNTSVKVNPAEASVTNSFVPRQWARKRIAALLSEIRKSAADGVESNPELEDEIVRLSLEHGILSEYTSFIAAADEDMARYQYTDDDGNLKYGLGGANRRTLNDNRSGEAGVSQQVALDAEAFAAAPAFDPQASRGMREMSERERETATRDAYALKSAIGGSRAVSMERLERVQQIADRTLINRADKWIDSRILENTEVATDEQVKPVRTIAFDSDEYWDLVDELARFNRQGLLAVPGDVVLLIEGEQVLVRNSPEPSEDGTAGG